MDKWTQCLEQNDNSCIFNLTSTSLSAVDTTPNSFSHPWGSTNYLRINSDGTKEVGVHFIFPGLEIGDIAELFAEVRVISGSIPKIQYGEYDVSTQTHKTPAVMTCDNVIGEWRIVKLKTITAYSHNIGNHRAFFGLNVGESGIFEIRSVSCTVTCKGINALRKIDKGYYRYAIKKVDGVWTKQNGSSEGTVTNPYNWSLEIAYPQTPYFPNIHIDSTVNTTWDFSCQAPPSGTKVTLNCKQRGVDGGASVNWSTIPDGTILYVMVVYGS